MSQNSANPQINTNDHRQAIAAQARVQIPRTTLRPASPAHPDQRQSGPKSPKPESQTRQTDIQSKNSTQFEAGDDHSIFGTDASELEETTSLSHSIQIQDSQPVFEGRAANSENVHQNYPIASYSRDNQPTGPTEELFSQELGENPLDEGSSESEGEDVAQLPVEDDEGLDQSQMRLIAKTGLLPPGMEGDFKEFARTLDKSFPRAINAVAPNTRTNAPVDDNPVGKALAQTKTPNISSGNEATKAMQQREDRQRHTKDTPFNHGQHTSRGRAGPPLEVRNNMSAKLAANQLPMQTRLKNQSAKGFEPPGLQEVPVKSSTATQDRPKSQGSISNHAVRPQVPTKSNTFDASELGEEDLNTSPATDDLNQRALLPQSIHAQSLTPKRPFQLDYDPHHLSSMPYSDLLSEPFEYDPHQPLSILPPSLTNSPLSEKLSYLNSLPDQNQQTEHQAAFFASLPIHEYEECGDLIVERFAAILNKFKEARRARRSVAMEFEEEVARREEAVRAQDGAIGKDMERLKRAGEDVVRGGGR
ncbi:hypothetical protein MMC20_001960 [Loxospora ochrophaea]|nr:hypothetical protein [Loxospora ochrophaea]